MKDEFSLESLKKKIHSSSTSEYFDEVYSSYIHGNYRSAVVMLWSVVVLDIIQKLQTLEDVYEDAVAISILRKINDLQQANNKTSTWELELVKEVCERTDLIDFNEYKSIEYLQQQRHLSAHPVLEGLTKLYVPNKDTTRALIRNALEIILIKPPVYTKKILNSLLLDLEANRDSFAEIAELRQYIKHKYLERMTIESKLKIFETIWKFTMHIEDDKCDENRFMNLRFLIILAQDSTYEIENKIKGRQDYYSKIVNKTKFTSIMIMFLSRLPSVYNLLNPETQIIIDKAVTKNLYSEIIAYLNKETIQDHYDRLKILLTERETEKHITANLWKVLKDASDSKEADKAFNQTLNLCYNKSKSLDYADEAFTSILKFINGYDIEAFEELLRNAETNPKTYERTRAYNDYTRVKEKIIKLETNFDFSRYPKFKEVIASRPAA